jgi:hypothetical protein
MLLLSLFRSVPFEMRKLSETIKPRRYDHASHQTYTWDWIPDTRYGASLFSCTPFTLCCTGTLPGHDLDPTHRKSLQENGSSIEHSRLGVREVEPPLGWLS